MGVVFQYIPDDAGICSDLILVHFSVFLMSE